MAKDSNKKKTQKEINRENLQAGLALIHAHPLFGNCHHVRTWIGNRNSLGAATMCVVDAGGCLYVNEDAMLSPKQWAYVLAHNILHLAFGHFDAETMPGYMITGSDGKIKKCVECDPLLWNMACDIYVNKFLHDVKFGQSIHNDVSQYISGGHADERKIYEHLLSTGISGTANEFGTSAIGTPDMKGIDTPNEYNKEAGHYNIFTREFTIALAHSVSRTVGEAGGHSYTNERWDSRGKRAAKWFMDHYPLLGGVASHFKIIDDYKLCQQNDIHIAAIDVAAGELYLNPFSALSFEEWKFVLAHEYLHAGLMHHERCNGRDCYLWNVACDFVINGWLSELQVGSMPQDGILFDPDLKNLSAETIYDILLTDLKKYQKLNTFRGFHKEDILDSGTSKSHDGITLDEFCRNAMMQGLNYHLSSGRGLIPTGLIEEIRALSMPPIPWDVALANWFDLHFKPIEKRRSYVRPSRRQACTPDIPRARYIDSNMLSNGRTFGVVLDTSGSMDVHMLGKALGSIASYAVAHEVPLVRVVFCDAQSYDVGYLAPEDIAGRVRVKGRGGTTLQPGIHTLETANDFPKDGPILIITDGEIEEHFVVKHEHAFLLPKGKRLPFRAKGDVFYFDN